MIEALVLSNIVSWLVILLLGVLVYALSRQIGVLHERIKPVGALSLGSAIQVGEPAPSFKVPNINGDDVSIGSARDDGKVTLLFFLSSSCPVCKILIPVLTALGSQEQDWLSLIFVSDGEPAEHSAVITEHQLQAWPYVLSMEVGMAYQISKLPYGVLISPEGQLSSHGLINNREHIESLINSYTQENSNA